MHSRHPPNVLGDFWKVIMYNGPTAPLNCGIALGTAYRPFSTPHQHWVVDILDSLPHKPKFTTKNLFPYFHIFIIAKFGQMITTRATTQNGWGEKKNVSNQGFIFPQFWESEYKFFCRKVRKLVEFSLEKHTYKKIPNLFFQRNNKKSSKKYHCY